MGIALSDEQLMLVLDTALTRARVGEPAPVLWVRRVDRLGQLGIRTYVAALGAALLAKATDDRIDSLAQDVAAGPRGYSLRKVAEFLAVHNDDRFHMGVTGRWPLNNSPFLRGPARIDDFTKISRRARPSYELFRDCLVELNRMTGAEAADAFLAWVQVRMAAQAAEQAADHPSPSCRPSSGRELDPVVVADMADRFARQDAEGGKRGQALVAAILDGAFDDVVLQSINDPRPGDVQVHTNGKIACLVEVKQVPVDEAAARSLAAETRARHASLALLAVIADQHRPLDRERLRLGALRRHHVLLAVTESVHELLATVAVFSATPIETIVGTLPDRYAERMRQHGVSDEGQRRWAELVESQRYASAPTPGAAGQRHAEPTEQTTGNHRYHQEQLLPVFPGESCDAGTPSWHT